MTTPTREELVAVATLRAGLRRFLARSDGITRAHGLTSRRYELLAMLHAGDGGCTPTELAERLQLSRNATTELITRAEQAGLVRRIPDAEDRRRKTILATPAGSRAFRAAMKELAFERAGLVALLEEISVVREP